MRTTAPEASRSSPSERFQSLAIPRRSSAPSRPDGPSTHVSRASPMAGATIADSSPGPSPRSSSASHSMPVRVFPDPRPPTRSQMYQSPSGGSCSGRAVASQLPLRASRRSRSASFRSSDQPRQSLGGFSLTRGHLLEQPLDLRVELARLVGVSHVDLLDSLATAPALSEPPLEQPRRRPPVTGFGRLDYEADLAGLGVGERALDLSTKGAVGVVFGRVSLELTTLHPPVVGGRVDAGVACGDLGVVARPDRPRDLLLHLGGELRGPSHPLSPGALPTYR